MTIDPGAKGNKDNEDNLPSTSISSMRPSCTSSDEVEELATPDHLEDGVVEQDVPAPRAVTDNDEETCSSSSSDEDSAQRKTSKVPPNFVSSKRSTQLDLSSPVQIFLH
ncbi:hypothetical protein ILUMI_13190, partial [Ignelater luminosus]